MNTTNHQLCRPPWLKYKIVHLYERHLKANITFICLVFFISCVCVMTLHSCETADSLHALVSSEICQEMQRWRKMCHTGTQSFSCSWMSARGRGKMWEPLGTHVRSYECVNPIRSHYWGFLVRLWLENIKGAVSPIIPSAPKCSSCHFIFHRKYVCFE